MAQFGCSGIWRIGTSQHYEAFSANNPVRRGVTIQLGRYDAVEGSGGLKDPCEVGTAYFVSFITIQEQGTSTTDTPFDW